MKRNTFVFTRERYFSCTKRDAQDFDENLLLLLLSYRDKMRLVPVSLHGNTALTGFESTVHCSTVGPLIQLGKRLS